MKKLILTLGIIAGLNSLYAAPIHDAARTGDLEKIKSRAAMILDIKGHVTTTRFTEGGRKAHAMADSTGFTVLEEDQLAQMSVDQTASGSVAGTRKRRM